MTRARKRWTVAGAVAVLVALIGLSTAAFEGDLWGIEAELEALREERIVEANDLLWEAESLLAELMMVVEVGDVGAAIELLLIAEELNFHFESALTDLTFDFLAIEEWFLGFKEPALHEALGGELRIALLLLKVEEEIALTKAVIGRAWVSSSILEQELCIQKKLLLIEIYGRGYEPSGGGDELLEIEAELDALRTGGFEDAYAVLRDAEGLLTILRQVVVEGDREAAVMLLLDAERANLEFESRLNELSQRFLDLEFSFLRVKEQALHEALGGDLRAALLLLKVEEEIALTKAMIGRAWLSSSILEEELCVQKKLLFIENSGEPSGYQGELWEIEAELEGVRQAIDSVAFDALREAGGVLAHLKEIVTHGNPNEAIELLVMAEELNFHFETLLNDLAHDFLVVEERFLGIKESVLYEALHGDLVLALLVLKVEEEIALTKAVFARAWLNSGILEEELCVQKKLLLIEIYP